MKSIEIHGGQERWSLQVPMDTPILGEAYTRSADLNAESCIIDALQTLPHAPQNPLIVVPDRTRNAHLPFWLPRIWRTLQQQGNGPSELHCLFASGTHAPMSKQEMRDAVGAVDVPLVFHAHDAAGTLEFAGTGPDGEPIFLAPALFRSDGVLVLSSMKFHYLAGFGGGRKMIIPGLCDHESARRMHASCLAQTPPGRARGVCAGTLETNPLHLWILQALRGLKLPPICGICMVNGSEGPIDAEGGDLLGHHQTLAQRFVAPRTARVSDLFDGVLLSCGGHPYDVDLVQAHKALDAVAPLLRPGARVAWLAALPRGLGHHSMHEWLIDGDADMQLSRLLQNFHIGKQTAWSIRRHLENLNVGLLGNLPGALADALGIRRLENVEEAWDFVRHAGPNVAIAPFGGEIRYERNAVASPGQPLGHEG